MGMRVHDLQNTAINIANHRETNLVITSLLIIISVYFSFLSAMGRSLFHPLRTPVNYWITDWTIDYAKSAISFLVLWLASLIFGHIATYARLPSLIGVTLTGIVLRNLPFTGQVLFIDKEVAFLLRRTAFTIVLIRASMGCRVTLLKASNNIIGRLGLVATICEIFAVFLVSYLLFFMRPDLAVLYGILLAATGSAVVIPCVQRIAKHGYCGIDSALPLILKTSVSLDNLTCICAFNIALSLIFTWAHVEYTVGIVVLQVFTGGIFGLILGSILFWFPRSDSHQVHFLRTLLLLTMSLAFIFGTSALFMPCAGIFATAALTIVTTSRWNIDNPLQINVESAAFRMIWDLYAMPVMFVLIGFGTELRQLDVHVVLEGMAILGLGMLIRLLAVFILSFHTSFNLNERFFLCLAYIPKATVQAALPSQLVDVCDGQLCEPLAYFISINCLFAILLCSTIGHLLLNYMGPVVLSIRNKHKIAISGEPKVYAISNHMFLPDYKR